ncbi:MAG: hypothetical protein ABIX01_15315 [Chitinophagaceae bacterium]
MTDKQEIKVLIKAGIEAGKKAQEENFLLGLPIYILEGDEIVEIDNAGNRKVIEILKNSKLLNGN